MTMTQTPSTKEDILNYLLKVDQTKAQELAEVLAISPQAIRRHLKDLETEGLIEHRAVQEGMGRPQYYYYLSKQGRDRFPNRYGEFAVSFLDTLMETVGEKQVGEVLKKQWERKADEYRQRIGAGSLQARVEKLVELRREEGYMAELHDFDENMAERKTAEKFILAEHHCAISEVAESYPTVCGHELEMFGAILPDCVIERTHWINNGEHSCGYLIQLKS
ncbi:MAG: iron-sulfur cluster biosynthesis transcriptional regulator SufR [Snowella sp.]|jgi:DeoR family suf operon transcriptional repressor|nr:MAG: iron-sulfur cluster biosynthesis transcriptional regulator SufR [Snowella sp.]